MGKPKCTQSPEPVLSCGVKAAQGVNGPRTESLCSECLLTLVKQSYELGPPIQVFLVQSLAGTPLPNFLKSGAGMLIQRVLGLATTD